MKLDERGIEQIVDMVINRLQKEGVEFSDSDSPKSDQQPIGWRFS
jgi:glycosidase